MRIMYTFAGLLVFLSLAPLGASARTIGVPGDTPSIQAGIDAASPGDTVLVQPGCYLETIDFKGKDIVVGSLFLATQDTSYISQTIIDGNKNGTVVTFKNGETEKAELCGVTVTGGSPSAPGYIGGGISCVNASPYLHHLSVKNNLAAQPGGGISLYKSSSMLESIIIKNNSGGGGGGGGIRFDNCENSTIKDSFIFNNSGTFGSGIMSTESKKTRYYIALYLMNNSHYLLLILNVMLLIVLFMILLIV